MGQGAVKEDAEMEVYYQLAFKYPDGGDDDTHKLKMVCSNKNEMNITIDGEVVMQFTFAKKKKEKTQKKMHFAVPISGQPWVKDAVAGKKVVIDGVEFGLDF